MKSSSSPVKQRGFRRVFLLSMVLLSSLSLGLGWLVATAQAGPDDKSLPTHPDFVIGELENGLTYMIKEHATPPGWIAIRLLETSGSLNEDEDQQPG